MFKNTISYFTVLKSILKLLTLILSHVSVAVPGSSTMGMLLASALLIVFSAGMYNYDQSVLNYILTIMTKLYHTIILPHKGIWHYELTCEVSGHCLSALHCSRWYYVNVVRIKQFCNLRGRNISIIYCNNRTEGPGIVDSKAECACIMKAVIMRA